MTSDGAEPTKEEVDRMPGPVLLEFGASWCGYCQALRPHLDELLRQFPDVRHVWVEDGRGKPLGRSFRVKLWPTLVFLRDGRVMQQLARPRPDEARAGLEAITVSD
jgi:thioredoxin 1